MMFGNIIGRGPHYVVEGTCHYTNANLLVIGDTAAGRKGSAEGRIRQLFHLAEPDWVANHITGGLSSGEGLIWSVRDPILKQPPRKGNGPVGENEIVDPGVADKRLVILESEFASVLRVMSREGNTLSAVIRQAFDGANLNIATKNSPARATGAHISVIGHITPEELRTTLKRAEAANGFLNRFLLVCARRSKSLPDGGTVRERDLKPIVERLLLPAVEFAKGVREMHRDEAARELWHHEYPALTQGRPGLLGAVAARGPAHAVRLSLVYALLDQSDIVRRPHLEAALAFWRYAEDSAAFIFGQSLGSPDAEVLAEHLRTAGEAGLTLTEMHHRFSGNASAARLRAALAALEAQGVARAVDPAGRTGPGRPAERWRYAGARPEGRDEETNETNNLTTMAPS